MDALDVAILRRMGLQPFLTWPHPPTLMRPAHLAREFGLPVETVRDRVAKLEETGVIAGYEVYPNFLHLGINATTFHFRMTEPRKKSAALGDVAAVEGVAGIYNFSGPDVCVDLTHRGPQELRDRVAEVSRALGGTSVPFSCFQYQLPAVEQRLSRQDWQLIRALRGDARRSLDKVAKDLRVTGRSVRRRLDQLARNGALDIVPNVEPTRMSGYILYELVVRLDEARRPDLGHVLEAFGDRLAASWPMPELGIAGLTVLQLGRNLAEMETTRQRVEEVEGVSSVEVLVPVSQEVRADWIDDAIERRIADSAPASKSAVAVA